MFLLPVNYVAVLLCAVASMVIGFLWYGPLFGKEWAKLIGVPAGKMGNSDNMGKTYGLMFLGSLLMAYALAHFVWYAAPGSLTVLIAVKTALWGWLGFVFTVMLSGFLFSPVKKPVKLLAIESGYYLVLLVVMGAILGYLPASP